MKIAKTEHLGASPDLSGYPTRHAATRFATSHKRIRVRNNFRIARHMAKGIQCRRVVSGGKT